MKTSKFEIADYLDSNELISEYLNIVIKEGDSEDVKNAVGTIAKAIGMSEIAKRSGLSRPSLYKAFSENSKPQFTTVIKVLHAIGSGIEVTPLKEDSETNVL